MTGIIKEYEAIIIKKYQQHILGQPKEYPVELMNKRKQLPTLLKKIII